MPATSAGPLAGRSAVVTGASRGIGLAIAGMLAGAGARTVCLARSAGPLRAAVESLGPGAVALACDLTNGDEVARAAVAITAEAGGAPDILVQNAGTFVLAPVRALEPGDFARTLEANLTGPYRLLHALLPGMLARRAGHVVTIGSVADRSAFPENAAYAASKFGARAVHEALAEELHGTGVRATLVSPAATDTSLWDPYDPDARPGFTPRARMLRPADVADAVLWAVTRARHVVIEELRLRSTGVADAEP